MFHSGGIGRSERDLHISLNMLIRSWKQFKKVRGFTHRENFANHLKQNQVSMHSLDKYPL